MNESIFPVIINSQNFIGGNKFKFKFPNGSKIFKNAKIALSNINMYYSWQNIKQSYNNNSFRIVHPFGNAEGFKELNITLPDGNYELVDINRFIQNQLILNNCYLVNDRNENVFYIELITNPTRYRIQLNVYTIPSTLPSGWTNPGSFQFPSIPPLVPTLQVFNNNFAKVIGFTVGAYITNTLGQNTPEISPISSMLLTCSLINNKYSNPNDVLYSFVSGSTKYGSMINVSAQDLAYINIRDGVYSEFLIEFLDNNYNPVDIIDTALIILLLIKIVE